MMLNLEAIIAVAVPASLAGAGLVWMLVKRSLERLADDAIDHAFAKKLSRYNNDLLRSTRAYEMLLEKELSCYEEFAPLVASMIVDVQDLAWCVESSSDEECASNAHKDLQNHLEMTKKFKSVNLERESFLPAFVFKAATEVVAVLQDNQSFWYDRVLEMREPNPSVASLYAEEARERANNLLKAIACLQTKIYFRLTDLSSNDAPVSGAQ